MKTLAESRELQILTGKLYIFIIKMTVEQGKASVWSLSAALTSYYFITFKIFLFIALRKRNIDLLVPLFIAFMG